MVAAAEILDIGHYEHGTIVVVILALYMAGMIGVGVWSSRMVKDSTDFIVAGRRHRRTRHANEHPANALSGISVAHGIELDHKNVTMHLALEQTDLLPGIGGTSFLTDPPIQQL